MANSQRSPREWVSGKDNIVVGSGLQYSGESEPVELTDVAKTGH
jgi:hypothetical protein